MQLFLVRHADSNFGDHPDHQRPLSERGLQQALQTANYLKQTIQSSDVQIICSDALRTKTTAQIIADQTATKQLSAENSYYHATVGQWCDAITAFHATEHLILVGHNPTISYLSKFLNAAHAQSFSPACVAHYRLEILADGLKLPAQFIHFYKPDANS